MFGLEIFDAGLLLGTLIALSAGVVSFISPCVLPIVPAYLAYVGGVSFNELVVGNQRRSTVLNAISFVLGLSVVFILLGAAASAFGLFLLQHQVLFGRLAGIVIVIFGLHFLGVLRLPFLYREARINVNVRGGNLIGSFLLGLAFAFGWTPCIGPVLGSVLSLAAQENSIGQGTWLLATYAVGLGLPFIIVAAFIEKSQGFIMKLTPWMKTIERSIGTLLIIVGLLLVSGRFSTLSFWLLETFPVLGLVG